MPGSDAGSVAHTTAGAGSGKKRRVSAESAMNNAIDAMSAETLEDIVKLLKENPDQIYPCYRMIASGSLKHKSGEQAEQGPKPFPATYIRLAKVPKDVIIDLAFKFEPTVFASTDRLKTLEKSVPGTLHAIFHFGMGTLPTTKWPKFAHNRVTFEKTFLERYEALGKRWHNMTFGHDDKGRYVVQWWKCGIFQLLPAGDGVAKKQVKHLGGKVTDLEDFGKGLGTSWSVDNNWNEQEAMLVKGKYRQPVIQLFPEQDTSHWPTKSAYEDISKISTRIAGESSEPEAPRLSEQALRNLSAAADAISSADGPTGGGRGSGTSAAGGSGVENAPAASEVTPPRRISDDLGVPTAF